MNIITTSKRLRKKKVKAYTYLANINKTQWARHASDHLAKSDHVTNNITKLWNGWLKERKGSPVLTLMDYIRRKVMRRLYKRMKEARTWKGRLHLDVKKKLYVNRDEGRTCKVLEIDDYDFEVIDDVTYESFVVDLDKRICGCGAYQISGIPTRNISASWQGEKTCKKKGTE